MTYHLAPSLAQLRAEANAVAPNRSKASDGWIGDTAHGARKSDHNPDPRAGGVVRALDLTNTGLDVDRLIARACADPRTAYVISRGLIYTRDNGFRPVRYVGANPHNQHVHISIRHGAEHAASTASWGLAAPVGHGGSAVAPAPAPPTSEEDDMTPEQSAKLDYIFNAIAPGESGVRSTGHVLVQLTRIENAIGAVSKTVTGVATSVKDVATAVGKIPAAVWGYRNAALEKVDDAYALLRKAARK